MFNWRKLETFATVLSHWRLIKSTSSAFLRSFVLFVKPKAAKSQRNTIISVMTKSYWRGNFSVQSHFTPNPYLPLWQTPPWLCRPHRERHKARWVRGQWAAIRLKLQRKSQRRPMSQPIRTETTCCRSACGKYVRQTWMETWSRGVFEIVFPRENPFPGSL